ARRGNAADGLRGGAGQWLVGRGAGAGATAALAGADDAGPLPGAAGDGRADLPRLCDSDRPSVPCGTLNASSQFTVFSCQLSDFSHRHPGTMKIVNWQLLSKFSL